MNLPWDELGDWQGTTVVVTGAGGYLGRFLGRALQRLGATVRGVDVTPASESTTHHQGDVRDAAVLDGAFAGADVVLHAAAVLSLLGIAPSATRARVWSVNVDGTQRVVDACRRHGVRALVAVSSANVVIDREVLEVDETAPIGVNFVDLYGPSKAAAEAIVLAADGPGLRTAAVRPGGIWGPEDGGLMIQAFLRQLHAGRFVATLGDPATVVDNTHVDTLVTGILLAARRLLTAPEGVGGEAFFLTDDERIQGVTWFRPLVEALGHPWPRWRVPTPLAYAVAWAGELSTLLGAPEPELTRIGVLKLTRSSSSRVDKARRVLQWAPRWRSADGLRAHADDYRAWLRALDARGSSADGGPR